VARQHKRIMGHRMLSLMGSAERPSCIRKLTVIICQ